MSLNDTSVGIGDTKGVDVPAGVANPTPSSTYGNPQKDNYVEDPTDSEAGAGAGSDFSGDQNAASELDKGGESTGLGGSDSTIEATKIEPIGTDPGQADSTATSGSSTTGAESILDQVTEAAKAAVSNLTGSK